MVCVRKHAQTCASLNVFLQSAAYIQPVKFGQGHNMCTAGFRGGWFPLVTVGKTIYLGLGHFPCPTPVRSVWGSVLQFLVCVPM